MAWQPFEKATIVERLKSGRGHAHPLKKKDGVGAQRGRGKVGGKPTKLEVMDTALRQKVARV
eukprot:1891425-Alexandrium_andersonii.AAC.1